ncbi:hypothetical protein SAY87_028601 [Trapa incisa]|uniref:Uncharacterized protein n=1 Tax=Trapa incisa TaxID=236973 RepID=A0AAN7QPF9_9MYRT|nr:hypothetical protein SAY87_028601 [Trapa incisa]
MTMDRTQSQADQSKTLTVLSIECLKGSSKAEEWTGDMLQTGDIVEELRIGGSVTVKSPFKNGRSGVQKILHSSFRSKDTSIVVRVRRGPSPTDSAELQACIVPNESFGKRQYMLRSIDDPNYAVGFCDRAESDCLQLIASRSSRMVNALSRTPLQEGYVSYRWDKKLTQLLQVPNSSCFLSILFLPKASDRVASRYNDLEDTLARANAWLNASQASGVPIVFMNIQTESLLTKISGETASSTVSAGSLSDLSNLATAGLYGFEDYHGVDIGVVRAVRLWYSPYGGELPIEIKLREGDTKLGFAISRTEEGFIYISSVIDGDDDAPSTRSGLRTLYREAMSKSQLLVVTRVSNQKVLPWIVSSTGAVRCYDTVSLSQKLSLHRHAKMPIAIHLILWEKPIPPPSKSANSSNDSQHQEAVVMQQPLPLGMADDDIIINNRPDLVLDRDTAGDISFRFHDFAVPNSWV